jgi:hypothetical protein
VNLPSSVNLRFRVKNSRTPCTAIRAGVATVHSVDLGLDAVSCCVSSTVTVVCKDSTGPDGLVAVVNWHGVGVEFSGSGGGLGGGVA